MEVTYLIVPTVFEEGGQCRIVRREGRRPDGLRDYRECPDLWQEAGLMNYHGRLVCLDDPKLFHEMKADEPLAAGMVYVTDARSSDQTVRD